MIISHKFFIYLIIHCFLTNKNHKIGNAVFNGEVVDKLTHSDYKYMVSIAKWGDPRCAGAIIGPQHILTAAHCLIDVEEKDVTVVAGVIELDEEYAIIKRVKNIHRHPEFVKPKGNTPFSYCYYWMCKRIYGPPDVKKIPENDIAVLILYEPLMFTDKVGPVNLPTNVRLPFQCKFCTVAGWGATKTRRRGTWTLNWTVLTILLPEECKDRNMEHRANEFCAQNDQEDTCPLKGDSGAPLVCDGIVIGVTSAGQCNPRYPTVFAKVFNHLEFIQQALKDS